MKASGGMPMAIMIEADTHRLYDRSSGLTMRHIGSPAPINRTKRAAYDSAVSIAPLIIVNTLLSNVGAILFLRISHMIVHLFKTVLYRPERISCQPSIKQYFFTQRRAFAASREYNSLGIP